MKRLQAEHMGLQRPADAHMEQFNTFEALENPAHGWPIGGLVHLVGNGLLALF